MTMARLTQEGDMLVTGDLQCGTITPSAATIFPRANTKHVHACGFGQSGNAVDETRAIHAVVGSTGVMLALRIGCITAPVGAATVTVDLKVNGTTALASVYTIDNATVARAVNTKALSSTALAVGDLIEVVIDATTAGGTLPTGVFVFLQLEEFAPA
jgi:hypothetical protein